MTNPVLHVSVDNNDDINNQPYLGVVHLDTSASPSLSSPSVVSMTAKSATAAAVRPQQQQQQQQQQFELRDSWIPASTTTTPKSSQQSTTSSSSSNKNNGWAHVLQYKLKAAPPERNGAEHAWFPSAPSSSQQHNFRWYPKKWRQCRYRRRVGQGQECYERVRDAALAWQFNHTEYPTQGILPVVQQQASSAHQSQQASPLDESMSNKKRSIIEDSHHDCFQLDDRTSQHVQPLWSGPHTEGSRRLVTFTSTGFKSKWLPKLYTMNPVMVVYDLLDQRYVA